MSILRPRLGSTFVDVCNIDYRVLKDGTYYRVKGGDYVFRNGSWEQIICALPFKWIIDPTGSSCEKQDLIVDVPITLTSNMGDGSSIGFISPVNFKKNVLTGKYIFNLYWKFNSIYGVGPNVYMEAFGGGAPPGHLFIESPIGQITDSSLFPSSDFNLYGVGCYGKALAGKIDTLGRIWMTSGEEASITAWDPGNPIFQMNSYNLDSGADFNGINIPVNTGYAINTKAKKVTDNVSEFPLDDNNQLTSQSGLPQSTKTILITDPDYRTVSSDCPVPAIGFGNARASAFFTKQCSGGFTGSSVEYVVPANTFYGTTQLIADNKAADAIDLYGQNYANSNGICTQTTFWNTVKTGQFSRNNCPEGSTTDPVTFVIPAGTYSASTQISADALAVSALAAGGQNYANTNGICSEVFTATRTADFQKNDCVGEGETGSYVTYSKDYTSAISQEDADEQAADDTDFNTEGQANANTEGECNPPLPVGATGIAVVDLFVSENLEVCGFVDTSGVIPYQDPIYTGKNFLPDDGTPAANCWGLASDYMITGFSGYRFEFNIARLLNTYPLAVEFVFKIRGRSTASGTLSGEFSLKSAESGNMTMGGSPGSYIPSTVSTVGLGTTSYSGKAYTDGADGNIGIGFGSDILIFTYNVSAKTLILS